MTKELNHNTLKKKHSLSDYGSLIALIVLVVAMSLFRSEFASPRNIISLLRQATVNGLIAFGMTNVILTGGIDLSVGSVLGLSAMLSAGLIKKGMPASLGMILALVFGILFGLISGLLITKGRLQPFIATLVTMTVYRGFIMIYCGGKPVSRLGTPEELKALTAIGKGYFLKIPIPIWIFFIAFAAFYFMLNHTSFGRYIYAVGSNEQAARLSGVQIDKTKIIVYSLSGFMASLAGLILLSRLGGSAQPTMGEGFEMDAIAATALGGTSMSGGRGKITGTLIGILIIAVLSNGLNILGVSSYYQDVVKGLVILIAVLSDKNR